MTRFYYTIIFEICFQWYDYEKYHEVFNSQNLKNMSITTNLIILKMKNNRNNTLK